MKIAKILWSKYSAKKDFTGVFRILLNICGGPFSSGVNEWFQYKRLQKN